jgi:hypothetical protein
MYSTTRRSAATLPSDPAICGVLSFAPDGKLRRGMSDGAGPRPDEGSRRFFWACSDKSFGFQLQLRQRATTLERIVDLSVVAASEVAA